MVRDQSKPAPALITIDLTDRERFPVPTDALRGGRVDLTLVVAEEPTTTTIRVVAELDGASSGLGHLELRGEVKTIQVTRGRPVIHRDRPPGYYFVRDKRIAKARWNVGLFDGYILNLCGSDEEHAPECYEFGDGIRLPDGVTFPEVF